MHSDTVPPAAYEIAGKRWPKDAPGFSDAIAYAFEHRLHPRCHCRKNSDGQGIEMYVARLMDGYIVKRMPNTGSLHATNCLSYKPPAEFSGLGPLVGTAIVVNPATGMTTLKLDFPMSKLPGRVVQPLTASTSKSVVAHGQRLGLRALLHYLWDQAGLTHWKPGFAGRRTWGTVRKRLLQAAENKLVHGQPLLTSLYIPEVFSVEQREVLHAQRQRKWAWAMPRPGEAQPLMLIVAEVKEIAPSRYGHTAFLKHIPDQGFALDETLYRYMGRCFERELSLWGTEADLHLVMMATFRQNLSGAPDVVELTLILTTAQWLPVEDAWGRQLMNALVRNGRHFISGLRYNLSPDLAWVAASLLDYGAKPHPLFIERYNTHSSDRASPFVEQDSSKNEPEWRWCPADGDFPPLPVLEVKGTSLRRAPR